MSDVRCGIEALCMQSLAHSDAHQIDAVHQAAQEGGEGAIAIITQCSQCSHASFEHSDSSAREERNRCRAAGE